MAHTVIPPPRGTTAILELTHKGNINEKTIPERDREIEILTSPCLRVSSPVVDIMKYEIELQGYGTADGYTDTSAARLVLSAQPTRAEIRRALLS